MSLPSGYTQLEYIESTGTQYIDTGLSLPEGFHAIFDVEFTSLPSTIQCVLGAHDSSYPYYRNFFGTDGKGTRWEMGCYGFADFGSVAVNTRYEVDVCNISGSIFCTVNGVAQTVNPNDATSASRSSRNIYVLGMNYTDGLFPCYAKLRSMKLYADAGYNTLLRDYVPCISDANGIGMFDLAESKFYGNAGTGTFTAGPSSIGTHKVLINGTEYEVKVGKCLVNGAGYDIQKGRTLIGGTGYDIEFAQSAQTYDPVFANNTWEQIIDACHNNAVPDTWNVADSKLMTINGTSYQIDIIGKNHDTYTAGGTAPLTFQLHDCYGTKYQMNSSNTNNGGYDSSAMHTTHLPAILALMPSEVQAGIKQVNKMASAGSQSATIETIACKLFLLSEIEIFGSTTYSKAGEGSQYAYYSAGNSTAKNFSGSAYTWWERSPFGSNSADFCLVGIYGNVNSNSASNSYGVAFGFCF